jgi:tRNA nucleotidyltransferase (CCA-adding enzyme)
VKIYLVGGAVRDELLGIAPHERDWVIVGATPAEVEAKGFVRLDAGFPVYRHPETGEEYALARRETKTGPGYKGFAIEAGPEVTLEEDLARRDLTINAMARSGDGTIVDPFGGREDLDAGLLRHVTPAFVEDPVRVLRAARFAAMFGHWGFRIAHGTHGLMKRMAASEDMGHVEGSRLWREMRRAFEAEQPWRFFEVLQSCGALGRLLPGLAGHLGVPAGHGAGPADGALASLRQIARSNREIEPRFAALFAGPVIEGMDIDALRRALPADGGCYDRLAHAVAVCRALPELHRAGGSALVEYLGRERAFSHAERLLQALALCSAIRGAPAEAAGDRLRRALAAARSVDARPLAAVGLRGAALRQALDERRALAVDEALGGGS